MKSAFGFGQPKVKTFKFLKHINFMERMKKKNAQNKRKIYLKK